jgi:tetratricopeptide (TPR) repeat protein
VASSPEDDREIAAKKDEAPPAEGRPRQRSIPPPPPIPRRSSRALLVTGKLETPTVLERAITAGPPTDDARIKRAEQQLAAATDPADAACVAYELGELYERLGNLDRAVATYRRAAELHPPLKPARWALRRLFQRRS